ncbi:uncharacterized protein A1O5_12668 [Cladophialophora psammophila CBS 110553]|uniref:Uncharacterized protein n=1 Tax=Cladophialophora psammophila CBS 110553 TaxID=1182543 RepID=W9VKK0_9EURO|nr:uncharacterized protein A1O5_12668 [Cladophialophora psammophila CBS 110553]EXJ56212.1 hypothetical protein A1O5_12668 [Cladophialophora psammophila CBS 110553]
MSSRSKDSSTPELHPQSEACRTYQAPTMQTPYMVMSLQAIEAPKRDNLLAAVFSWITLAGFIFLPGTFTSLKNSDTLGESKSGQAVQGAVQNIPLLPLAGVCYLVGVIGSYCLWRRWRRNYIWLVGRIFLPGVSHSVVGLATMLINVYTAQDGYWSVTAKVNIIIIALYLGATSALTLLYNNWLLEKIKTPHDKELAKRLPR